MARRSFSSGLAAAERSQAVVAPPINPPIPVIVAGPVTNPGAQAILPIYSNQGISPYTIGVSKPTGAAGGYNVTYRIGAAAYATASFFPFNLVMANAAQTFDLFANDSGAVQSIIDTESWNTLYL